MKGAYFHFACLHLLYSIPPRNTNAMTLTPIVPTAAAEFGRRLAGLPLVAWMILLTLALGLSTGGGSVVQTAAGLAVLAALYGIAR